MIKKISIIRWNSIIDIIKVICYEFKVFCLISLTNNSFKKIFIAASTAIKSIVSLQLLMKKKLIHK